jgi:PIN domain nuclease of toxin-antitoxin system
VNLLLDTHALLWALTEPKRLGRRARRALSDRDTQLWVSAASAWEVATKHRLGKLPGAQAVTASWFEHLGRLKAKELPITGRHALFAGSLDWDHRDPFDRMLAAQSLTETMTLVTKDPDFSSAPGVDVLW